MRIASYLRSAAVLAALAFGSVSMPALADESVDMLNKHPESKERNVFYPPIVKIQPGETVTWISKDKGHNVEFVKGAVPDGVPAFRSKLNQDAAFTFETPGVYVYKCSPHYGLGMVGIVVVGDDMSGLEAAADKRYPGKAGKRLDAMFAELGQ